ncbi:Na+/H+ antiporter subunit D [Pueribacillus theae]|uniref:Na+/H+ antiporter subunit D n=1 Tax=Pueribacillus theae TaxID=2171751 RepID=A0A2U1K712_9BACI|nr:Na+/H+ antiporter subunit D [Pueribacillus theae]PWA12753.1 Na+/H+ antiporter subunit D [Pueribacillus theae]
MNNLILFPVIAPFLFAAILMFIPKKVKLQRALTIVALTVTILGTIWLLVRVYHEGVLSMTLGDWQAPFGITMVSDLLSVLLVLTTTVVTLFVVLYSFPTIGVPREKFYYYSGVLFLLTGVNGSFTTGDLFNLFVFFEVLLMASYLLIVIGGEKVQLRESIKYILVNVISSAFFVIAVAYLYSITGTLNMADLAVRIPQIEYVGILTTVAVLFLVVFGLKGAIFPLYFWLPSSYSAPPTAILALFGALLTKVGVYAIMRTYTLFFTMDIGFTHELLAFLSIATILAGCIGALAYFDVKKIIIYNVIIAVGVILFGASQLNESGLQGALYYIFHDMIIKAALFFMIGLIAILFGTTDLRKMGGLMKTKPALGWFYLIAAFGLAGIPPLSGFAGKLLIVKGGFENDHVWGSIIILVTSLLVLLSVMRIFIYAFWGEPVKVNEIPRSTYRQMFIPSIVLVGLSILYGIGTEWLYPFVSDAANVLQNPSIYIDAVLKE